MITAYITMFRTSIEIHIMLLFIMLPGTTASLNNRVLTLVKLLVVIAILLHRSGGGSCFLRFHRQTLKVIKPTTLTIKSKSALLGNCILSPTTAFWWLIIRRFFTLTIKRLSEAMWDSALYLVPDFLVFAFAGHSVGVIFKMISM